MAGGDPLKGSAREGETPPVDPSSAGGMTDDVARLVGALREAEQCAAGIDRKALRDFVRVRLREGREADAALLVAETLQGADLVDLVPELVALARNDEYGERIRELLGRIPFDEAAELVVPEALAVICAPRFNADYWDVWNQALLLHHLGYHRTLRHVVEIADSSCNPDMRMVGEWIVDELLSTAGSEATAPPREKAEEDGAATRNGIMVDVTGPMRRVRARKHLWSPDLAWDIARGEAAKRNFTIIWNSVVGESWMSLRRDGDLLGYLGADLPLLFCTAGLAEGTWPDPVVVVSVPSFTRSVLTCDRRILEGAFGSPFPPWELYPSGFSVQHLRDTTI